MIQFIGIFSWRFGTPAALAPNRPAGEPEAVSPGAIKAQGHINGRSNWREPPRPVPG